MYNFAQGGEALPDITKNLPTLPLQLRKRMTKTLLLLGGGVVAYALLVKAKALGSVNFFPDKVQSLDFDGATPVLVVSLLVQNTTTQKFIIRSIAGNVSSAGYLVGNVGMFQTFTINPNSQGVIYIPIRFSLIGVVQDIINAFQTQNFVQEISIDLLVNVDNTQISQKLKYKVGA